MGDFEEAYGSLEFEAVRPVRSPRSYRRQQLRTRVWQEFKRYCHGSRDHRLPPLTAVEPRDAGVL